MEESWYYIFAIGLKMLTFVIMQTISTLCVFLSLFSVLFLVIGLIKPSIVLPEKWGIKKKRLFVFWVGFLGFMIFSIIGAETDPNRAQKKSSNKISSFEQIKDVDVLNVSDSLLAVLLKHDFDSLYARYQSIDILDPAAHDRGGEIKKMQSLLLDGWWELMERIDSARTELPLCRKEYDIAYKKLDKAYARYLIYGNEYEEDVKIWAKMEAERLLKKTLADPKSLEIIDVISCTQGSKGYRCKVKYRAKNALGGYFIDQVELLMTFDADNNLYKCIDAK